MQEASIIEIERNEVPREPSFTLAHKAAGRCTLEIWGALSPGWLGSFTSGLAGVGISILQGEAHKVTPLVWKAAFELQAPDTGKSIGSVDFLALATGRVPLPDSFDLRLTEYSLRPDRVDPTAICVEISGRDQAGFLVGVLKQFSLYSLFPTKMLIDTEKGRVFDRFWVKGIGGFQPSSEAVAGIRRCLDGRLES